MSGSSEILGPETSHHHARYRGNVIVSMCRKQQPLFPVKYNLDLPESFFSDGRCWVADSGYLARPV